MSNDNIRRVIQYPAGTDIDPRQIRQLTPSDSVTVANQIARDADGHGQIDVLTLPPLPFGDAYIGKVGTPDLKDAVSASGSISAADNTNGLVVAINNDYRTLVQFRVTLGGAGVINVEASHDGAGYFLLWSKTLSSAGSYCDWDLCGFPYFRINVPTTGIDIAINIRAIKL